jgi:dihydrofolate reductase
MHLVRYQLAVSLDGFISPSDGSADWLSPYGKVAGDFVGPWMRQIGGIILGRATYDQTASMGGWMWGKTPALLMSSRPLAKKPPAQVEVSDDIAGGLKRLRERMPATKGNGGDIWLFGGGVTAGHFLKAGLIDMIELTIVPVALGAGRRLFDGVTLQETFELGSVQQQDLGCVSLAYRRIDLKPKRAIPPVRRSRSRSRRDSR